MTIDVFFSHDAADAQRIVQIIELLRADGLSVWWSGELAAGELWHEQLTRALEAAGIVVVAWTANSVKSQWVRDEAEEGRDSGRLVPILLDVHKAPLGFRGIQAADFRFWDGTTAHPAFQNLLAGIRRAAQSQEPLMRASLLQLVQ